MNTDVPYIVHESQIARLERVNKRFFILVICLLVALIVTNGAWLWYESQFEDVVITAEQSADGNSNNYAVGGDYYGGETKDNGQEANS